MNALIAVDIRRCATWTSCRSTPRRVGGLALPDREPADVLSENRAEGPVRPVYQGDGGGSSRDARVLPTSPPAGVLPGGRRPFRARLPPASGCCAVQWESHERQEHPGERHGPVF